MEEEHVEMGDVPKDVQSRRPPDFSEVVVVQIEKGKECGSDSSQKVKEVGLQNPSYDDDDDDNNDNDKEDEEDEVGDDNDDKDDDDDDYSSEIQDDELESSDGSEEENRKKNYPVEDAEPYQPTPKGNEKKIDDALANEDLDELKRLITPKNLANCETNCVEKSFEVSHKLKSRADAGDPDAIDLRELGTAVEIFAIQLLETLRQYDFQRSWSLYEEANLDLVFDNAVKYQQKKIFSHSFFYNLLMIRWMGCFGQLRHRNTFKWFLLNVWTFFDIFLFPVVHIFLGMIHLVVKLVKKRQDLRVVFVYNASRVQDKHYDNLEEIVDQIEDGVSHDTTTFHTVVRHEDGVKVKEFTGSGDVEEEMEKNVEDAKDKEDKNKGAHDDISDCLKKAKTLFKETEKKGKKKKVLIVLMDDKTRIPEKKLLKSLTRKQKVMVIFVPTKKEHNSVKELETIARSVENVSVIFNVYQNDIVKHIKGKDIFERYVEYFNTPYFIFFRDILSYLVLLGLHFAMCLQPSTIHFTLVELIIAVFFLGRVMMEINQLIMEIDHKSENTTWKLKNKLWRIVSGYLHDWWNKLDVVILIVYLIIVGLRVFIWSQHFSVPKNRLLAVAGYLYGLNAMFLTLRVFGTILESNKSTGSIQIALFHIISAAVTIFGQFLAVTVGFSLAITKIYVAEVSYNSGKNSTSIGLCGSQNHLECWWNFLSHLTWSLLGIGELTPLESSDGTSDTLARILYGVFLIMGVVMLMNMMIALLSNTYKQVEDNAFHEWTYKKAITIRTYDKYHPVPVPFNIISLPFMLLQYICCYKCTRNHKRSKEFDEWILKDLPDEYFAVHGNAFPIVGKKQNDLVFEETKGNRAMNEWIIQHIFCYNQQEMQRLKANGDPKWKTSKCITTSCQRLELSSCKCGYDDDDDNDDDDDDDDDIVYDHGARFCVPLSEEFPKFEVLVAESGARREVSIGVVPEDYELDDFPGEGGNSAGYRLDNGEIFDSSYFGRVADDAMAFRGDRIGCKILYGKKTPNKLPVSFTLNGRVVGQSEVDPSTGDKFYPYVGIGCKGVKLMFRFCFEDTLPAQEDPVLQMLKIISERLTELERNMGHPK